MRTVAAMVFLAGILLASSHANADYNGRYSANRYDSDSTSNEYGSYGSRNGAKSINNPHSPVGRQTTNPYQVGGPKLVSQSGQFLGNLNSNRYDPNSVSNPYGQYGSKYSPNSINNPHGQYGSKFSNQSANNPYATNAPRIFGDNE